MKRAVFRDMITEPKSGGSSGRTWYCEGTFGVRADVIPEDAPQDWALGTKMKPGDFGAFLENALCPRGHSPYAFVTAKTEDAAQTAAAGFFRERVTEWSEVKA